MVLDREGYGLTFEGKNHDLNVTVLAAATAYPLGVSDIAVLEKLHDLILVTLPAHRGTLT